MTKKSHNKKRNVGIIYEQLVLKLSKALVENDKKTFQDTKTIIKKFFKKNTELYKEYRLLNSLVETQISERSVIPTILEETKRATYRINKRKLDLEKSKLIRSINETFGKSFYSTRVSNYRDLATVDMLLSEFKKGSSCDHKTLLEYSDKVTNILLREKSTLQMTEMKDPEINSLVVKIMREKFNKSYSKNLSNSQMDLVSEWILNGSSDILLSELKGTKSLCENAIKNYRQTCDNNFVLENLSEVENSISSVIFEQPLTESHIVKAMTMHEIIDELSGDENEQA